MGQVYRGQILVCVSDVTDHDGHRKCKLTTCVFSETAPDGSLDLSRSNPDQLPVFVAAAKENVSFLFILFYNRRKIQDHRSDTFLLSQGVKALVSVGGWIGSKYFSTNFATAENRTAFAQTCMDFISEYDLDGLDFDFEYPNRQGLGCNTISANDTTNFLLFLQELRSLPGASDVQFTAASSLFPWNNAEGVQSTDLSGFADVLDYIMIMNYDLYGMWSANTGPNAPLASACDARNNQGSATAGIDAWIAAGVPADKIVLGVAAYGHGFRVNQTSALGNGTKLNFYANFNSSDRFQGSSWDNDPPIDDCGNAQPHGGTYPFWSMITEAGFLDESGEPLDGIVSAYDDCSQTPAVWNSSNNIFVSYDNAKSFAAKGQYILDTGLHGFAMWEAGGDYNNILVDSIRGAVGL